MKLYSRMKESEQESFRERVNLQFLENILLSMFEYTGLPNTIPKRFLEKYLIEHGSVGIGKIDGELYAFVASPCGNVDAYGVGTELTGATPIGDINGVIGKDVVVGYNNYLMKGESILSWFSHIFSEIDLSMDANVINARYHPAPVAKDSKAKAVIDKVLNNMRKGKLESIISKNVTNEWDGNYDIPVVNLTNVTNIDKIQYLSRFYDDILKRFYNMYGHALQTQNKTAQQTTDEIHGMDSASLILPLNMLECRKEMVADMNKLFNLNVSVDFSPTWKLNFERFYSDNSTDASTDASTDTSTDASTDSSEENIGGVGNE